MNSLLPLSGMPHLSGNRQEPGEPNFVPSFDAEVVELSLLLPRWQVQALESVAHHQGMTAGQMIRQCLAEMLRQQDQRVSG